MKGDSTSTASLVQRARDPDASLRQQHEAFTVLVQRTQHLVFGLALTRFHDIEDARDATQDAYATAWRRLTQLRDPASFASWLKMIVASECSRRWREGRRCVS